MQDDAVSDTFVECLILPADDHERHAAVELLCRTVGSDVQISLVQASGLGQKLDPLDPAAPGLQSHVRIQISHIVDQQFNRYIHLQSHLCLFK